MRTLYSPESGKHVPPYEIFNGKQEDHAEVPARGAQILKALREGGFQPEELVGEVPRSLLQTVHTARYLEYLQKASESLCDGEYKYPSVFSHHGTNREPENPLALLGYYSTDMYTPMMSTTFRAAVDSASLSYQGAFMVCGGKEKVVYALCRPPGHHAEKEQMGGYCYINNAAVAAEHLAQLGKVATLDVDFHHGNGTQQIFYDRGDVLTVSLHANPGWKFPFYSGEIDELGEGRGTGYNRNYPLKQGTTNEQYQLALTSALDVVYKHRPEFLVVALGVDTHESDPIGGPGGGFQLTTDYYERMAQTISQLNLPTVIVQEGGYNTAMLGSNVISFLRGYQD